MIKSADLHRSCSGRMINSYFHRLINFSCQFVFVFINSSSYYFTVFNRVKSNPGLHWFCLTLLCDWSSKLAPLPQPIRCKTNINHDLVTRAFPRFRRYFSFCSWAVVVSLVLVLPHSIEKRSIKFNL